MKVRGEKFYNNSFGSDTYKDVIKPIVDKALGGTLRLFVQFVYEGSYYSQVEETKLYVNAMMEEGIPVAQMNKVVLNLEQFIATFTEVKQFNTTINSSRNARIVIYFKPEFENSSFPYILKSKLTQKAIDFGGMEWSIYGVGQGFYNSIGVSDPINYSLKMYGYNFNELKKQAEILKDKLELHPRVKNVNIEGSGNWGDRFKLFQFNLNVEIPKLALYKKSLYQIQQAADAVSLQNSPSLQVIIDQQKEDIYLKNNQSEGFDTWQLMHTPLSSGSVLTLGGVAKIEKQKVSSAIYKFNQQYLRTVQYQYNGNYKFGNQYRDEVIKETKPQLPLGYSIEQSQYTYWGNQQQKPYHLILLIILGIFMISSILFESLKQPFAIIGIIPLSYIGIFITFYFFDLNFDQGGYASFILITGLVVNSAIYIINSFNTMKKNNQLTGKKINEVKLYLKAFNSKIIPVILTISSSALGLVPFMMLGKQEPFWFAFSAGSIGGLVFSLVILFIYLPVFLIKKKAVKQ